MSRFARRALRRAHAAVHARRAHLQNLRPPLRTVHRLDADRIPPPSAFAHFGEGSWVVPPATVPNPARVSIGHNVVVMEHSTLDVLQVADGNQGARLVLGDGTILARFNTLVCGVGITVGERVASSDSATVFDTWWPGAPFDAFGVGQAPVTIGRHAYLGCNSIVGPGVTIGEGAFIGEGAVVIDDVPAHSVVYGNPARVVRHYDPAAGAWRDVDGGGAP